MPAAPPASTPKSSTIRSPWKTSQVAPVSGQAMWISQSGSSASSEMRFQANRVNSMPNQRKTSASASTAIPLTIRSAAAPRAPSCGQTSTSKCVPSRTPSIAPNMIDQMKRKRAISSVQM